MVALLYTILICTVAVVLSTPASNEKWKLMGKLLTDAEPETPALDDLLKQALPTPLGDPMCANIHHTWKAMPFEMKEKVSDLGTSYPKQGFSRPCYWSWNTQPGGCPPFGTYKPRKSICYRTRHYAVFGKRRYCCAPTLGKPPILEIRLGQIRCRC
ncbi:uncharacterized protein LOC125047703 [Penaeus chinensis]|uniref:uncharacterized protein LOC125047703 n=1 Tax=Penaeus chinensis TaxID=139456 RepID=UPI001FB6A63E|nr:uncharacterized protein LOC125047703 [Penaeus chinensis]